MFNWGVVAHDFPPVGDYELLNNTNDFLLPMLPVRKNNFTTTSNAPTSIC